MRALGHLDVGTSIEKSGRSLVKLGHSFDLYGFFVVLVLQVSIV
jgi:hypothetical protein